MIHVSRIWLKQSQVILYPSSSSFDPPPPPPCLSVIHVCVLLPPPPPSPQPFRPSSYFGGGLSPYVEFFIYQRSKTSTTLSNPRPVFLSPSSSPLSSSSSRHLFLSTLLLTSFLLIHTRKENRTFAPFFLFLFSLSVSLSSLSFPPPLLVQRRIRQMALDGWRGEIAFSAQPGTFECFET